MKYKLRLRMSSCGGRYTKDMQCIIRTWILLLYRKDFWVLCVIKLLICVSCTWFLHRVSGRLVEIWMFFPEMAPKCNNVRASCFPRWPPPIIPMFSLWLSTGAWEPAGTSSQFSSFCLRETQNSYYYIYIHKIQNVKYMLSIS